MSHLLTGGDSVSSRNSSEELFRSKLQLRSPTASRIPNSMGILKNPLTLILTIEDIVYENC